MFDLLQGLMTRKDELVSPGFRDASAITEQNLRHSRWHQRLGCSKMPDAAVEPADRSAACTIVETSGASSARLGLHIEQLHRMWGRAEAMRGPRTMLSRGAVDLFARASLVAHREVDRA